MSGRGAGYCAGFRVPGHANPAVRGGRARGYGCRNMYHATGLPGWARFGYSPGRGQVAYAAPQAQVSPYTPDPEQEKKYLENQADVLQQQLADIQERLGELEEK